MERYLYERGQLAWRSRYVSLGGIVETGGGLDGTGYGLAFEALSKHGGEYLAENGVKTVVADVERRFKLYFEKGAPKAFINVGGGVTALGWVPEAALLGNGLIEGRLPETRSEKRGLIWRMREAKVPVIHLLNIERLAREYNLPIRPKSLEVNHRPLLAKKRQGLFLAGLLALWLGVGGLLVRVESP
jgi:poly-gamma-glutamate system protein